MGPQENYKTNFTAIQPLENRDNFNGRVVGLLVVVYCPVGEVAFNQAAEQAAKRCGYHSIGIKVSIMYVCS